jgi:isoleucyl-tRNA synthetase
VHLTDFPVAGERDVALEDAMAVAREAVRLGMAARGGAKVKVRQPLREAVVVAPGRERDQIARFTDVVREELNVRSVRFVEDAEELGSYTIKPNYRSLGPRFGKSMPQVAAAVEALDPAHVAAALRAGRTVGVSIEGHDHELTADDLQLRLEPLEGYQVEREAAHAVALDLTIDDDLRTEMYAREVVRAVQNARKNAGLEVEDRIALTLGGDGTLLDAARAHEPYIAGEVLAVEVAYDGNGHGEPASIEGLELRIALTRA